MSESDETNAVRMSFRTTARNWKKVVALAKEKGLVNARGKPNISAALNLIIEQFDAGRRKRKRR